MEGLGITISDENLGGLEIVVLCRSCDSAYLPQPRLTSLREKSLGSTGLTKHQGP